VLDAWVLRSGASNHYPVVARFALDDAVELHADGAPGALRAAR
jgi:hypothetical protein